MHSLESLTALPHKVSRVSHDGWGLQNIQTKCSPSCKDHCISPFSGLLLIPLDSNYASHVNKLESVQKFAARFVTRRWSDNCESLLSHHNWPKLCTRRKKQKLLLCNHILNNRSILPPSLFTPHPSPHLRHNHPFACIIPLVIQLPTCPHWISVLYHCGITYPWMLCVPSLYSFKKRLKFYWFIVSYILISSCTLLGNFSLCMHVLISFFWFLLWAALILASWLGGYFPCTYSFSSKRVQKEKFFEELAIKVTSGNFVSWEWSELHRTQIKALAEWMWMMLYILIHDTLGHS